MKSILRIALTTIALGAPGIGIIALAFIKDVDDKPDWDQFITVKRIQTDNKIEGSWALNGWHGYMGTALQLKDGAFNYWFYSDVVSGNELAYPVTGRYRIKRGMLILGNEKGLNERQWIWGTHDGENGFWPDSSLDAIIRRGESPDVRMLKRVSAEINPSNPVYNTGSPPRRGAQ